MPTAVSLADRAIEVARCDFPVFPLWWPRDGGCACRDGRHCKQPGKHPRISGWQAEATTDEAKLNSWWDRWPMANVGIATGRVAGARGPGILVIDVDVASGGAETLAALEAAHGPLPETVETLTGGSDAEGRRGRHIYFRHPEMPLGNSVKKLGPGVDSRCDGGLVVGPGSRHASGLEYEWEAAHHPADVPLADSPDWLINFIAFGSRISQAARDVVWAEPEGLPALEVRVEAARVWLADRPPAVAGQNGSGYTMGICAVVTRGFALERDEDALAALGDWNTRCAPPWDESADARSADSLLRKIREARSKSYVCAVGEKLQPPRRVFFGSQIDEMAGGPMEAATEGKPESLPVLAFNGAAGELWKLVSATERALAKRDIYCFGGNLVTVRESESGPTIQVATRDHLRVLVNSVIGFAKPCHKDYKPCWPPDEVLGGLIHKGCWSLPEIAGIVEAPTLRPDGTVIDRPGFDRQTGILFVPGSTGWTPIPERPSEDDVVNAMSWLQEPFRDFPFQAEHHRAAAIAAVLTAVLRQAIDGPVPMFLFDADTPGTGKGLMANVVATIATGRRVAVLSQPSDEEEMRKTITTLAMEGARMAVFDNVTRPLGGPSLDAAITATRWLGRILGSSRTFDGPLRPFWGATGNNLQVGTDMHRRVVPIRMVAGVEDPELRSGFAHPDLLAWVAEHRPQLVGAALTLVKAYFEAGCPRPSGLAPVGGFERWDQVVRAPLIWQGAPDILTGRRDLNQQQDEVSAFRAVIELWQRIWGLQGSTLQAAKRATDAANTDEERALKDALGELVGTKDGKDWDPAKARATFRRYQGRVFGGLTLVAGSRATAGIRWVVQTPGD